MQDGNTARKLTVGEKVTEPEKGLENTAERGKSGAMEVRDAVGDTFELLEAKEIASSAQGITRLEAIFKNPENHAVIRFQAGEGRELSEKFVETMIKELGASISIAELTHLDERSSGSGFSREVTFEITEANYRKNQSKYEEAFTGLLSSNGPDDVAMTITIKGERVLDARDRDKEYKVLHETKMFGGL